MQRQLLEGQRINSADYEVGVEGLEVPSLGFKKPKILQPLTVTELTELTIFLVTITN